MAVGTAPLPTLIGTVSSGLVDAVSIGPEIRNAHSPDEMVHISSVQRFYEHVKALLKALA